MEPTPAPAPAPAPAPVTFTQEEVDRIRAEEFGKGKRLGSEGSTLAKQERERLQALEKDAAERAKADEARKLEDAQKRGDFEKSRELIIKSAQEEKIKEYEPKLTAAQERIAKLEGRFSGMLADKVKAAAAGKAYNPDQVVALLVGGGRVRLNADYDPEVLSETGEPALVGGKPMTIDQLVDGYLSANPNLVKSSGGQGGGAGGGASLKGGELGEIAQLEAEVEAAKKRYLTTKLNQDLTAHRLAVKKLTDAKAKAAT